MREMIYVHYQSMQGDSQLITFHRVRQTRVKISRISKNYQVESVRQAK